MSATRSISEILATRPNDLTVAEAIMLKEELNRIKTNIEFKTGCDSLQKEQDAKWEQMLKEQEAKFKAEKAERNRLHAIRLSNANAKAKFSANPEWAILQARLAAM